MAMNDAPETSTSNTLASRGASVLAGGPASLALAAVCVLAAAAAASLLPARHASAVDPAEALRAE